MPARRFVSIAKAVGQVLATRPGVLAGYIFGSVATERARPTSDVDVAVLVTPTVIRKDPASYRLDLMADLGAALRTFHVDVVLLNTAPSALAHNIISQGKLVSERSRVDRVRFHVRTLNRFLDTQPLRDVQIEYLRCRYVKGESRGR